MSRRWACYLLASAVVATVMSLVGLAAMRDIRFHIGVVVLILLISNLIWLTFAVWFARQRQSLLTAVLCGAASPYIAATAFSPPWGWILITQEWYRFIPVGITTGASIYALSRYIWRDGKGVA